MSTLTPQDSSLTAYGRTGFAQRTANAESRILREAGSLYRAAHEPWTPTDTDALLEQAVEDTRLAPISTGVKAAAATLVLTYLGCATWMAGPSIAALADAGLWDVVFAVLVIGLFFPGLIGAALVASLRHERVLAHEAATRDRFTELLDEHRPHPEGPVAWLSQSILTSGPDRLRDLGAPEDVVARAETLRDTEHGLREPIVWSCYLPEHARTSFEKTFSGDAYETDVLAAAATVTALAEEARIAITDSGFSDPGAAGVEIR